MRFVVKTASCKMPSKVKAPYRKVAILEVEDDFAGALPSMISLRAKGVKRIVYDSGPLHAGGVNNVWTRTYDKAGRVCANLDKSLAALAIEHSGESLAAYIRDLINDEKE